ncbi:MAG: MoaD/ThiS family protein [Candidatus Humimicrobiia bacterium]
MIQVKLYANLVQYSKSKKKEFEILWSDGMNVEKILKDEGISKKITKIIMINGRRQDIDFVLKDGDRVAIFPPVGGG